MTAGTAPVDALRLGSGDAAAAEGAEWLAEEQPVALQLNGIAHAVMLATPLDLHDFALGFLLTEGLIDAPAELLGVTAEAADDGIVLQLEVTARCEMRLKTRRRALAGRTGCGLCGIETLAQLELAVPPLPAGPRLQAEALNRAMDALPALQPLQQRTGATHAAAWCGRDGSVRLVREDVGRHNALDKVVGAMLRAGADPLDGFAAITSRASYEMARKAARAGIAVLAAVSAPTRRAVAEATAANLTLAGFVRGGRATVYSHPWRLDARHRLSPG